MLSALGIQVPTWIQNKQAYAEMRRRVCAWTAFISLKSAPPLPFFHFLSFFTFFFFLRHQVGFPSTAESRLINKLSIQKGIFLIKISNVCPVSSICPSTAILCWKAGLYSPVGSLALDSSWAEPTRSSSRRPENLKERSRYLFPCFTPCEVGLAMSSNWRDLLSFGGPPIPYLFCLRGASVNVGCCINSCGSLILPPPPFVNILDLS